MTLADREFFLELNSDPDVQKSNLDDNGDYLSASQLPALFNERSTNWGLTGFGSYVIYTKEPRQKIGICNFAPARSNATELRKLPPGVGCNLLRSHRLQGYGTEAMRAAVDTAFANTELPFLIAQHTTGNAVSEKLVKKLGAIWVMTAGAEKPVAVEC